MISNDLVIAQVTDMHIGPMNIKYRGIEPRRQFLDVLRALTKMKPDLLVLSGDLAAVEGEPEAYAWIRDVLVKFPYPYLVMAGNHDHVVRMNNAFQFQESDISQGMLYFSRTIKDKRLLFLDSSPYRVAKQQLEWLKEELNDYHKQVLLFIHHPPLRCGCPFMDDHHGLQNGEEVWQVLEQFPQIQHIFCGHYHAEKTVIQNGKSVHLTPSTVFQIDAENPKFAIAHTKPGWRMIEWSDMHVHTYVTYL
jgi:3',5'-cyclic-AMP phosphodiesterase